MRLALDADQRAFTASLDDLLHSADVPAVNRARAAGDLTPGLRLWQQLSEVGLPTLAVPAVLGGIGASLLDIVAAVERLGAHGVPGPWVESAVLAPTLLAGTPDAGLLSGAADGSTRFAIAATQFTPYAVDADFATHLFVLTGEGIAPATITGEPVASVDPARRLFSVRSVGKVAVLDPATTAVALDRATLACAAYLVGMAERMLSMSVTYVSQRRQFGRVIGEYQALKHALADVRVRLDFAHPLVLGAARALDAGSPTAGRSVSAAKVFASDTAHLAARTALQVHGAIGYTLEYDLSIWLLRTRALMQAWGTAGHHRARVLEKLARG